MQAPKLHQLKPLLAHMKGHTRLLILGPLAIEKKLLNKTLKEILPTLILLIDGGEKHKKKLSLVYKKRTLTVGDGDSSSKQSPPAILLAPEKDFSDLAFAFYGMKKSKICFDAVALLGFYCEKEEKRPDHFLFNLGELYDFVKKTRLRISMDERFLFLPAGKNTLSHKGPFSVIALEKMAVKISGHAKYTLPKGSKLGVLSSHGLSNIANGLITLAHKKPLIVYLAGTKKSS